MASLPRFFHSYGGLAARLDKFGLALALVSITLAVQFSVNYLHPDLIPLTLFLPAVIAAAWIGGFGPGLLATLLGGLAEAYFFIEPHASLAIAHRTDLIRLGIYAAESLFIATVVALYRQSNSGSIYACRTRLREALEAESKVRADLEKTLATASRNEALLRVLCESTPDLLYVKDREGRLIMANPAALRLIGKPAEKVIGQPAASWCDDAQLARAIHEQDQNIMSSGESRVVEEKYPGSPKGRVYLSTKTPVRDDKGEITGLVGISHDITEQVRVLAELRDREERLRALTDALPSMIWITTSDQTVEYLNETAAKFTGLSLDLLNQRGWTSIIHPEDVQEFESTTAGPRARGEAHDATFRFMRKDGSYRYVSSREVPLRDASGNVVRWVRATTDIHEAWVGEERLRQAERRFRLAADSTRAMIYEVSLADDEPAHGYGLDRLVGAEPGTIQLTTQWWRSHIHPDDLKPVLALLRQQLGSGGCSYRLAYRLRHLDGRFLDVENMGQIVRDERGRAHRLVGAVIDVSERKAAERSIKASKERLKIALRAAKLGVWEHNLLTDEQVWSERTYQIFCQDPAVKPNLALLRERIHPDDRQIARQAFEDAVTGTEDGASYRAKYRIITPDDSVKWICAYGHVHFEEGEETGRRAVRVVGTVQDVTDEVNSRLALETAKQEADAANAAKSAFLANMSHEIRTPLGAVLGFSELLASAETDEERSESLAAITRNGELLSNVINDILDLSKVEAGRLDLERSRVSISEVLKDLTSVLKLRAGEKGIVLETSVDPRLPQTIVTDPLRLRQILFNIVGNAIKFTNRGEVAVEVTPEQRDGRSFLAFYVSDTGAGIAPEQVVKLFQPFTQADPSTTRRHGGTGLGLALSKRLACALGGDVELISSTLNGGSTFRITVALGEIQSGFDAPEHDHANRGRSSMCEDQSLKGAKILVAEDSPDNQRLLERILARDGAEVVVVPDGLQAVLNGLGGNFDVVLMDLQMPVMDGLEATSQLRARGYRKPIIALTAHAMTEERERCLRGGFDEHLSKPINRVALVAAINRLRESWAREVESDTCNSTNRHVTIECNESGRDGSLAPPCRTQVQIREIH